LAQPPNGDNQRAEVSQWIGLVKVSIAYHSPRVHFQGAERTGHIWGELIPFGFFDDGYGPSKAQPWRSGANERTRISFSHEVKIEVPNVNELYAAELRKQLQGWAGFNYRSWQQAAQFCADNKVNLQEALVWADKAINEPFRGAAIGREDFSTLSTKAAVLTAM